MGPEGRRPEGMVECPRGAKTRKPKLFRYILKTYSYIFVAQAVILTVKRSLKRRKKADNKEKEKKRQKNQKNEIIRRKGKDKKRKRNIKENQHAADKNLPGVQARCAVFYIKRSKIL